MCVSCLPTGSLCGDGTSSCYLLPVFDTVFVRRQHRRRGLGLAMLQDFCQTFRDDEALGISWPISPAMYQGDGCVGEEHLGSGTRISHVLQMLLGREIPRSPGTVTALWVFSSCCFSTETASLIARGKPCPAPEKELDLENNKNETSPVSERSRMQGTCTPLTATVGPQRAFALSREDDNHYSALPARSPRGTRS